MSSTSEAERAEFRKEILRSERVRSLGMITVTCLLALPGMFRIAVPVDRRVTIGVCVLADSLVHVILEIFMLLEAAECQNGDRSKAWIRFRVDPNGKFRVCAFWTE